MSITECMIISLHVHAVTCTFAMYCNYIIYLSTKQLGVYLSVCKISGNNKNVGTCTLNDLLVDFIQRMKPWLSLTNEKCKLYTCTCTCSLLIYRGILNWISLMCYTCEC